jgi:uncharacterized protein DUF3306
MASEESGFLSRWSRRKVLVQQGVAVPECAAAPDVVTAPLPAPATAPQRNTDIEEDETRIAADDPPPTMDEVAALTPASDFSRFVARDVDSEVRNAALRKLFTDPHFNVMDGLDIYIDDYNKPDPLPAGMLEKLSQSHFLGLFREEPVQPTPDPDENSDLQLQPDDAAGCAGPETSPGDDAGCEPGRPGPRP